MNFLFTRENIRRPPIPYIPFHIHKETHTHELHEITYQHRDVVQLLRVKLVGKKRTYDPYNDYEHIDLLYY